MNPCAARLEGVINIFGIIGVKPGGSSIRCVMRSDVQPNVKGFTSALAVHRLTVREREICTLSKEICRNLHVS